MSEDTCEKVILIRQATKTGYIPCKSGGVFDCSYPSSKLRRGRVQGGGEITPTLTTGGNAIVKIDIIKEDNMSQKKDKPHYEIRKLTPKECYRLMDVTDKDADKMLSVNSNSQCYKQAGNSIVVSCLSAIFSQLNIKGVKPWNDRTLEEKRKLLAIKTR